MRRVVIDVDVGSDDYLAILVLLHAEKLEHLKIEAITCTAGNTSIQHVMKNTIRLLELTGRTDIPIYKGAHEPLIRHTRELHYFHGIDGFGDLFHEKDPDLSIVREETASVALVNLVLNNPKEISLICLAPLTNIATSMKLNENFADSLRDIWIMGGNYCVTDNDNLFDMKVEFNFAYDPEAANIVLNNMRNSVFIMPWETTLKPTISFDWRYNTLGGRTAALRLLTEAEKTMYTEEIKYWMPCDAFLAFAYIDPDKYVTKSYSVSAEVIIDTKEHKGLLLVNKHEDLKNVIIIESINEDYFKEFLMQLTV